MISYMIFYIWKFRLFEALFFTLTYYFHSRLQAADKEAHSGQDRVGEACGGGEQEGDLPGKPGDAGDGEETAGGTERKQQGIRCARIPIDYGSSRSFYLFFIYI